MTTAAPKPLVNWHAVSNTVKRCAPKFTKTGYVKVKIFAEWLDNHPELCCADLRNVPMQTMKVRISTAMRVHLKWRVFSKGDHSAVFVVPEGGKV